MADPVFAQSGTQTAPASQQVSPNPPTPPVAKPEPTAEDLAKEKELKALAELEEKKRALRAELKKLEAGEADVELTLEDRVFKLESLVASIAGHPQPVAPVKAPVSDSTPA
jgi:hypothetical protein